jgi:hypothetical protein
MSIGKGIICDQADDARRQVKRFFTWFMQSLPLIARFCRTSGHAVTSQIRIAVSVSVLAAIGKKGLSLEALSYIWRQIVSITLFKRMIFKQAVSELQSQSRRAQLLYPTKSMCLPTGHHRQCMVFAMREV